MFLCGVSLDSKMTVDHEVDRKMRAGAQDSSHLEDLHPAHGIQPSHCEENTPAPSQGPCVSLDFLGFSVYNSKEPPQISEAIL